MAVQVGHRVAWLACEMRAGVLHAKYTQNSVRGARRTTNAAGGLLSSTIRRRQRLVDGHKLVDTQVDVQNVKKLGAGQEKGASG